MKKINAKHKNFLTFLKGFLLGVAGLSLFYYLTLLAVTKDFGHPVEQFELYQPWMSILILGFGIQVGLYLLLRRGFRLNLSQKKEAKIATGAGGAMSGVSMAACCAHHVAEITPILGLTGAAFFLTEYQKEFLILGIFANLLGVAYMSWIIAGRKHPREIFDYAVSGKEAAS